MKKLLAVFLASLMIFSAIPTFASDGATDIYVSVTSGSDSAVGSAQAPLRSIEAALSIAKNELALGKAVNIILRGGEYRLNNVITLNNTYSGVSAEKPLTIKGFEGEEAVFKASQVIDVTNAQPVTDEKVRERLYEDVRDKLINIIEVVGGEAEVMGDYPAWEYKAESKLREEIAVAFENVYGKEVKFDAIHAGLECGILSEKIEGLDCVSFGPQNFDIHTPQERLNIESTERVWNFLVEFLKQAK